MGQTKNRFKMIASAYLVLIKNHKILLTRRFNTGYHDGQYSLPAGHVEDNETLTQSLIRESHEEVGVMVNGEKTKLVHVMHRKDLDIRVDYFFKTSVYTGILNNQEPDKCDDISWFPVSRLPENTIPYIDYAINCIRKNIIYSEFGW